MMLTKTSATFLGCVAIILWSIDTLINVHLLRLPVFQVLASVWLVCFLIYVVVISLRRDWSIIKLKATIWLIGAGGLCGAHATSVAALRFAPPEHVSTLSVSWPIFVVAFGGWFLNQGSNWRSLLSSMVGFVGVATIITDGKLFLGYQFDYVQGYLLAIISFMLWSSYVLMTRRFTHTPSAMIGMYLGVGSLLAFSYHFSFNTYIEPTLVEWLLLISGGTILAISYVCWDLAIKKGHFFLLNILSYFNPIVTVSLLIMLGICQAKCSLWLGAMLVTLSALLCANRARKPPLNKGACVLQEEQ